MAELELDVAHARALAQQLRRHGVAERVRVDPALDPRPPGEAPEQRADVGGLQREIARLLGVGKATVARALAEQR